MQKQKGEYREPWFLGAYTKQVYGLHKEVKALDE